MGSEQSRQEVIAEFGNVVNMTRRELQNWLSTSESKQVGEGRGESKGHRSGRRIVELLGKKKSDYTARDVAHMRRVHGYVSRHLAQRPGGEIESSNWRHSLMNWAHDPLK